MEIFKCSNTVSVSNVAVPGNLFGYKGKTIAEKKKTL